MSDTISQFEPCFGTEEQEAVTAYMREGGWITEFRKTEEFENSLARFVGANHCITVNNGTVALMVANMAVGIEAGDEVIVPNYTMIATPNSVSVLGAKPVFVDVEPETLCLNLKQAVKAITPRTKAMMLVAANGRYPKMPIGEYEHFCAKHNLMLIEDSAQALGSRFPDGRHMGTVGCIGSFSFSTPKIISTGQGGCIVTDDDGLADRCRRLKDFGRASGGNDIHDTVGFNFKFTDLQACVGLAQMAKLEPRIQRKREICALYREGLNGVTGVKMFDQDLTHTTPWFYDVLVKDRDGLQTALKSQGIGTRPMYPPINKQKAYGIPGEHPVSNEVGEHGLWLPSSVQLTDQDIHRITTSIGEYCVRAAA